MKKYQEYLASEDWRSKRREKLYRKGGAKKRCSICASEGPLDVHHLNYRGLTDVRQSDLRLLCRRCHRLAHRLHRSGKISFRSDCHMHRFAVIKNAVRRALGNAGISLFGGRR